MGTDEKPESGVSERRIADHVNRSAIERAFGTGGSQRIHDAQSIIGHLEDAKRALGPVYGKLKRSFPESATLRDKAKKAYDICKELQDDLARLLASG